MLRLRINLNPVPASRPKVRRFGPVYYGKRYTQWRKDATALVPEAETTLETPLYAYALFAVEKSKSSTLTIPVGDGDNYEKALYDLLQSKGYIKDDRQIVEAHWQKVFLPHGEQGYTEVVLKEMDGPPNTIEFLREQKNSKT